MSEDLQQSVNQMLAMQTDILAQLHEVRKMNELLQSKNTALENDNAKLHDTVDKMSQEISGLKRTVQELSVYASSHSHAEYATSQAAPSARSLPSGSMSQPVNIEVVRRTVLLTAPLALKFNLATLPGRLALLEKINNILEKISTPSADNPTPKLYRLLADADIEHTTLIPSPGHSNRWKVVLASKELVWQLMATKRELKNSHDIILDKDLTPDWKEKQDALWPARKMLFPYRDSHGVWTWFKEGKLLVSFPSPNGGRTKGVQITSEGDVQVILQERGIVLAPQQTAHAQHMPNPHPTHTTHAGSGAPATAPRPRAPSPTPAPTMNVDNDPPSPASPTATQNATDQKRALPQSAEKAAATDPKRQETSPTRSSVTTTSS